MVQTNEKAIDGRTSGLIEVNETVTWQAKHLFKNRYLRVKITEMIPFEMFTDEMIEGDFKFMHHEHHFVYENGNTIMKDVFKFKAPFGIAGKIFCKLYLAKYMRQLLYQRNLVIKEFAETDKWKRILN